MKGEGIHIFGNLSILSQEREDSGSPDPNLSAVIARRTTPGILIFTFHNNLVYANAEAREMLRPAGSIGNSSAHRRRPTTSPTTWIPDTVTRLCSQLKQLVTSSKPLSKPLEGSFRPEHSQTPSVLALAATGSKPYSLRAFFLSNGQNGAWDNTYTLILVERISPTKKLNLNKTGKHFRLSQREIEVIGLLIQGLKNKEMAEKLCVCVYTVEGHLKKIMKKMQVGNRTSILAKLLEGM